jgi:hypothetical protein
MTAVIALPPPIKQVPNHYRSISIHIGMVREEKISGNWTGLGRLFVWQGQSRHARRRTRPPRRKASYASHSGAGHWLLRRGTTGLHFNRARGKALQGTRHTDIVSESIPRSWNRRIEIKRPWGRPGDFRIEVVLRGIRSTAAAFRILSPRPATAYIKAGRWTQGAPGGLRQGAE